MATIKFYWKNLSNVEEKVRAEIDTHNSVLFDILKERKTITEEEAVRRSEKKFYKNPKLKDENGNSHTGWKNVLAILKGVDGSPLISETIVDIEFKLKDQAEPKDTDLLMDVRTVFSFSSEKVTLDPEISGSLRHRRICDYEPSAKAPWL